MGVQRFERVFENRTRQVWAIAVKGNNASLMTFCEMRKHRSEACSKSFTVLGNYAHFVACQLRLSCLRRVGALIANSTSPNDRASASVSSRRQQ